MAIPTEPIGSIPRTQTLIDEMRALALGRTSRGALDELADSAVRSTIQLFEATGSPIITDGEQSKPSFATYPIAGLPNLGPDGVSIPFADGHVRRCRSKARLALPGVPPSSSRWRPAMRRKRSD